VTLARSARARTSAVEGAAVRDATGRSYVACTVDLPSLSLSALQAAVAVAVASGADTLEAAALVGDADEPADDDLNAVRDLGHPGTPVHLAGPDGTVAVRGPHSDPRSDEPRFPADRRRSSTPSSRRRSSEPSGPRASSALRPRPGPVGALRLLLAATILAAIAARISGGARLVSTLRLRATWVAGIGQAAFQVTFLAAVELTGVAVGTLLAIGTAPVWSGLIARHVTRGWAVATGLAVVGLTLLVGSTGAEFSPSGAALAIGAGLAYAVYTAGSSAAARRGVPPATATAGAFAVAASVPAARAGGRRSRVAADPRGDRARRVPRARTDRRRVPPLRAGAAHPPGPDGADARADRTGRRDGARRRGARRAADAAGRRGRRHRAGRSGGPGAAHAPGAAGGALDALAYETIGAVTHRSGFACFVGRPNAGKSTLTNAMVGEKVAITSSRPQTTRHTVRGIVHRPDAQLVLVDTPGLHKPRTLLGERLNDLVRTTWRRTTSSRCA
jgi:hypothetical protein